MGDGVNNLIPLIDGDLLVYRCGFAADAQAKKDFGDNYKDHDYISWALANVKTVVENILFEVFPAHPRYNLYLTGKFNFREQVATLLPYKGNRDPDHKPKYYNEIKEYLIDTWNAQVIDGMEADDAVGIEQYKHKDKSTVIVSTDKDLDCIPGHHYNWVKKIFYYVTLNQANLNFLGQMLEGDRSDNIPGINGIGPKTVPKIIAKCNEDPVQLRNEVVAQYKNQYGNEWINAFNEVATLLWILREEHTPCPFLFKED